MGSHVLHDLSFKWRGQINGLNLQATKLFIVTSATKGSGYHPP